MTLPKIVLTNHSCALRQAAEHRATRVLSILDPGEAPPHFGVDHLALHFHDVASSGGPIWIEPPIGGHVDKIIQFARSLRPDDRCVVFCHAGISRSPAAILIIVATLTKSAQAAAVALHDIDPAGLCDPNTRVNAA